MNNTEFTGALNKTKWGVEDFRSLKKKMVIDVQKELQRFIPLNLILTI